MSDQTPPKNPDAPASVSRRDFIATGAIAAAAFWRGGWSRVRV